MSFGPDYSGDPKEWNHTNYSSLDASANTDSARGYEPADYQTNAAVAAAEAAAKANANPANHMAHTGVTTLPSEWNHMNGNNFSGPDNGGNRAYAEYYMREQQRLAQEIIEKDLSTK